MVKGISRQVIVVHSPDPKLFEQAIFILKDEAVRTGVTEEALLKEARRIVSAPRSKRNPAFCGPVWACGGAVMTGIAWLIASVL